MMSKILIYVDDLTHLDDYRKVGASAFLFALDGYSVGYQTYSFDEIKNIEVSNKYIILNRVLDCKDVDSLRQILPTIATDPNIKGIVFEDIAVYNLVHDLGLNLETILFQNHFASNVHSVNFWLNRVEMVMLNNEITADEISYILEHANRPVCVHLYGYNQVMYSRRLLLTNWSEEFNISPKFTNILEDKATHVKFRAMENTYGTVMYSDKIYNGSVTMALPHQEKIKYYYVNTTMIPHEQIMTFLKNLENSNINPDNNEDDGFLNKETIYKLKERNK